MKKLLSFLIVFTLVCALGVPAFAEGEEQPKPGQIYITEKDGAKKISKVLEEARKNATAENPYEIHVAAGTYTMTNTFFIFSNTSIIADAKAKFVMKADTTNMLKVGTKNPDPMSGYGYENIKVIGGDWNMGGNEATMFKFVHAKNCELTNVNAHNIRNAHFVEIAGVDGMKITNSSFYDMKVTVEDCREAIQIDILHKNHIYGYQHLECEVDYLCKNISITNCKFTGVKRGVASHTAVVGKYFENITISGNTFKDIKEKAIMCYNMKNLVVAKNSISCGEVGIELKTMDQSGAGSYLSVIDRSFDKNPAIEPLKAEISNNTIVAKKNHAIFLNGVRFTKGKKAVKECNDYVPAGDYYVGNVNIHHNKLTAYGKKSAVKLKFTKNVTVDNNTVTANSTSETPFYIIDGSYKASITNNTIAEGTKKQHVVYHGIRVCNFNDEAKYPKENITAISGNKIANLQLDGCGIRIADAVVGSVSNNKITNLYYRLYAGILVEKDIESAGVNHLNSNVIKSCKTSIRLIKATAGEISGNKLYATTANSIQADTKSIAKKITNNVIDKSGDTAILLKQSNSDLISGNKITNPKEYGMFLYSGAKIGKIHSNAISGCGDDGVYINTAAINYLESNTISKCKGFGVYVTGSSSTKVGVIKNNKISSCSIGLKILRGPKVGIHPNTFSKNSGGNKYVINGYRQYYLGNTSAVGFAANKSGKTAKLNWVKNSSASGYLIYRSTNASTGFKKIGTVGSSTKAYTDKSVKAKTAYYYRILPYYNVSGSNVAIYAKWTQSKVVKF